MKAFNEYVLIKEEKEKSMSNKNGIYIPKNNTGEGCYLGTFIEVGEGVDDVLKKELTSKDGIIYKHPISIKIDGVTYHYVHQSNILGSK